MEGEELPTELCALKELKLRVENVVRPHRATSKKKALTWCRRMLKQSRLKKRKGRSDESTVVRGGTLDQGEAQANEKIR